MGVVAARFNAHIVDELLAGCLRRLGAMGLGEEGVVCLLSDSTRAENPGYTPSERTVGEAFREIMEPLDGRVIVATFASNIGRVQQVIDAAWAHGRKMVALGRSMEQNTAIALEREQGFVFLEVLGVEVRRPPVRPGQKNTGSRYAPNTSSIAARIS